jgi:hypothetical protein
LLEVGAHDTRITLPSLVAFNQQRLALIAPSAYKSDLATVLKLREGLGGTLSFKSLGKKTFSPYKGLLESVFCCQHAFSSRSRAEMGFETSILAALSVYYRSRTKSLSWPLEASTSRFNLLQQVHGFFNVMVNGYNNTNLSPEEAVDVPLPYDDGEIARKKEKLNNNK